jgi:hypothetical protein
MPVKRAESLIHLAQSVVDGTFPLSPPDDIEAGMKALQQRPGIGAGRQTILPCAAGRRKMCFCRMII